MYFVVTRERGRRWNAARPMREQASWDAHASFMDRLVSEGFVILGGPIGDGERVLLIVEAGSPAAIHTRLADDPWTPMELLPVVTVEPWTVMLRASPGR